MRIFVTGGMGSGKSMLLDYLKEKGAVVILADAVGHENLHDPEMKAELAAAFGDDILDADGEVIRGALAAKAFASPEATARLDAITQPRLYVGILRHIEEAEREHDLVVLEMAILDGRDDFASNADLVVCVTTDPEVRVSRLMAYRGVSEEDARNRLASQVPEERRIAISDVVLTNDGTIDEFRAAIDAWWNQLMATKAEA
jgi:dephospho-CoA kinase